jgi:hypothetical protein
MGSDLQAAHQKSQKSQRGLIGPLSVVNREQCRRCAVTFAMSQYNPCSIANGIVGSSPCAPSSTTGAANAAAPFSSRSHPVSPSACTTGSRHWRTRPSA